MKMKVKIRLSDIITRPHDLAKIDPKALWFNSLEDNSDVLYNKENGLEQYKWNILLKSIKEYGYDSKRFRSWIKVVPFNEDTKMKKFLLQDGNHRVAVCKHLYGDDFKVEALIINYTFTIKGTILSCMTDDYNIIDERGMEDE